jgi:preprotein translocase SecE subunit
MAVAVKNIPETFSRHFNRLAVESWLGVLFVLASIGIIFYGLPWVWSEGVGPSLAHIGLSGAVQTSLLILAMILATGGLVYLGVRLTAGNTAHGLAAGVFIGLVEFVIIGLFTCAMGRLFEQWFAASGPTLGIALTVVLGVALLAGAAFLYLLPGFERVVLQVEDQGWFTILPYKRTQGQRVRRGTILGILVLAGCGIFTMLQHNVVGPGNWYVTLPFTGGKTVTLLPSLAYTVPVLLAFASFWLAYRVANLPVFADFLIATEAELNKVSWTTQRRLIQDTIVVLVTVILLTIFLFVVDQIWAWALSHVGVLQIAPSSGGQTGPKELPW